jgi:uncharacterized protein (DUF2236 family)
MPFLPRILRPAQALLVKAAVHCLPAWARTRLGLDGPRWALARWQLAALRRVARLLSRLELAHHPATLARRRIGAA